MKLTLVKRTVCYRLTFTGWTMLLGVNGMILFFILKGIAGYLVVNEPLRTNILVVDGMMPGYGYDSIASLVRRNHYDYLITTGIDLDYTYNPNENFNIAAFSYKVLSTKDLGDCRLVKVPAGRAERDRTLTASITLKKWFINEKILPGKINVIAFSCHARRTWLVYRKTFRGFADVGIITVNDNTYNYRHWYRTSKGVRMVLSETIGLMYTTFFIHPKTSMS
ncbi:MAG: hypothetical protein Kow00127_09700 [Bacteroidales bacterium]